MPHQAPVEDLLTAEEKAEATSGGGRIRTGRSSTPTRYTDPYTDPYTDSYMDPCMDPYMMRLDLRDKEVELREESEA